MAAPVEERTREERTREERTREERTREERTREERTREERTREDRRRLRQVPLHELERRVGHLAPSGVDDQRVPAPRDDRELGVARVLLLDLELVLDDDLRHRVVVGACDQQQRPAVVAVRDD